MAAALRPASSAFHAPRKLFLGPRPGRLAAVRLQASLVAAAASLLGPFQSNLCPEGAEGSAEPSPVAF